MIIIIKNIPASTTEEDLEEFITPALKGGWLSKNGVIETISIKAQKDTTSNTFKYNGLIRIMPDSVAERVIKRLNRKRVNGRHILVTEFHIRNWHNDPRISRHQINEELQDNRKIDRRRRYVEIDLDEAKNQPIQLNNEHKSINM
ncbi:MAG: RNA-binding protein [Methylococcales bacterium]